MQLDQAAFASPRFAELFARFGAWLQGRAGGQRAALRIHRYLPFFVEIEQRWGEIPAYPILVEHFGAEGLRRVRLPMKWLIESHHINVCTVDREADSENRRVSALVASVPVGTVGANALAAYREKLQSKIKAGKLTIRSMRLALRPAASLLLAADASGHTLPDQITVDRLLRETPGQRSALSGFINFLNQKYALNLLAIVDEKFAATRRRRRLEATLISLAMTVDGSDSFLREWIGIGLVYFHGLPNTVSRLISNDAITTDADGYRVSIEGQEYWLPTPESVTGAAVRD
ncbi:hypothetical protein [Pseudomonas aeruginosa]|uniref:hypothetical protein n=1 Tax=Pseudomonas aeruginosa TaxID=287 RepID=UPI000F52C769|nr:hypothetical protein [Pseudomonas aeruginosa]